MGEGGGGSGGERGMKTERVLEKNENHGTVQYRQQYGRVFV